VSAWSHCSSQGTAARDGVRPLLTVLNPAAGVRMAVCESVFNLVWAGISQRQDIKGSGNWMWPAHLPGESAKMYYGAEALSRFLIDLGIAEDGGKDSPHMAAKVDGEIIKSPNTFVFTSYAHVPDVGKVVTPDLKGTGNSVILLAKMTDKNRLGGSALAQCYGQIGDEGPDIDDPEKVKRMFDAITEAIKDGLILAGHDCSDGGILVALLEMCFAGNTGVDVSFCDDEPDALKFLFAEEPRLLIECASNNVDKLGELLAKFEVELECVGNTHLRQDNDSVITVSYNRDLVLCREHLHELRVIWQEFGYHMELAGGYNPKCVEAEKQAQLSVEDTVDPVCRITFSPAPTSPAILEAKEKPKVAFIRGRMAKRKCVTTFTMWVFPYLTFR